MLLPLQLKRCDSKSRALVFVQRIADGKTLAKALNCGFYRGSSDRDFTPKERDATALRWWNGVEIEDKVMVATDAFGPGNDYPHVRWVYFVGVPRGVVDFLQMAGRGGRDGDKATIQIYILTQAGLPSITGTGETARHLGTSSFQPVLKDSERMCWRRLFTKFLDGVELSCLDSEVDWRCPCCAKLSNGAIPSQWFQLTNGRPTSVVPTLPPARLLPSTTALSPQVGAVRARAPSTSFALDVDTDRASTSAGASLRGSAFLEPVQAAKRAKLDRESALDPLVKRYQAAADKFSGHCAICMMAGGTWQVTGSHDLLQCPSMQALLTETNFNRLRTAGQYLDWRRALRYPGSVGACFKCHMPFLQDRLHPAKVGKESNCPAGWLDMVGPMVYWGYFNDGVREAGEQHFRVRWGNDVAFGAWLMRKEKNEQRANMARFWLWLVEFWVTTHT